MKNNKKYNILIIIGILIIPFMYSFFYLKAYWDPYGKGNIDNIDVAIVNKDTGDKGNEIITSIKNSKKLKLNVVSQNEADKGLNEGKYYAVISIPKDFTENLESINSTNKKHPTITYSPNQKTNYLSSQIINSVVNAVEKKLDNEINSNIVKSMSNSITEVPNSLDKINNGFKDLSNGTSELNEGTTTLNSKYNEFNEGLNKINNGTSELEEGADSLNNGINEAYNGSKYIQNQINEKINELNNSTIDDTTVNMIKTQSVNAVDNKFTDEYKNAIGLNGVNTVKASYAGKKSEIEQGLSMYGITNVNLYCNQENINEALKNYCIIYNDLNTKINDLNNPSSLTYQTIYSLTINTTQLTAETVASEVSENIFKTVMVETQKQTISSLGQLSQGLNTLSQGLNTINKGSNDLYKGIKELKNGTTTLYNGSNQIKDGINKLNIGTDKLDSSVKNASKEIEDKTIEAKEKVKTLENIDEFSKEPVKINTKVKNEVPSYGTAFGPLFISIALWVGCLMMYVVLYYDKEQRFELLGKDSNQYLKRTIYYHILATLSAIVLGILLQTLLEFEITNVLLYYVILILVSNAFMAIIEFLIVNLDDVGKFLALIILVLQLAASGGTFPIQTVSHCFRWLNKLLPMTYTIKLIKEPLIKIESSLLRTNIIIVIAIFIIFFMFNIINDLRKQK